MKAANNAQMQNTNPIVDMCFTIRGNAIPLHHGHMLYAAIASILPDAHGAKWLGIHSVIGRPQENKLLLDHRSRLKLRIPIDRVGYVLGLSGKTLVVGKCKITIGTSTIKMLSAAPALYSPNVCLRLTPPHPPIDADELWANRYKNQLQRELASYNVICDINDIEIGGQRFVIIHGRKVRGFAVKLNKLCLDDSIIIQANGLGGRRTFGYGIFYEAT